MNRLNYVPLIALLLVVLSCGKQSKVAVLTLTDNPPYYLEVKDFQWSYGLTEFNKFNGDFATLDQQVFDLLKGKDGSCTVRMEQKQIDTYGKTSSIYVNIGIIDLMELNKYTNWDYWHKAGGMQKMVYDHFIAGQQPDSLKGDTLATQ